MTDKPYTLGSTFIRRGYHYDSYGMAVDPKGPYQFEAADGKLIAFWRSGLSKPRNPQTLVKATT